MGFPHSPARFQILIQCSREFNFQFVSILKGRVFLMNRPVSTRRQAETTKLTIYARNTEIKATPTLDSGGGAGPSRADAPEAGAAPGSK
jgi:hypothetical protein